MATAALTVDLNARIAQFETEMKRATGTLDKFGKKSDAVSASFKSFAKGLAGTLTVSAAAAYSKSIIDFADNLNDMSQRLGVSVKDLASFKLAAEQSGTSLEGVGTGIARLSKSIGEAEGGNKKLALALTDLGITSRDPKEAFFQLADAVQRIGDPSKRAALLSQVLGKSYGELVPLLAQGSDALRESAEASATFAEQMAKFAPDADKFNDQLAQMQMSAAGAAGAILGELVPALNDVFERIGLVKDLIGAGGLFNTLVNTAGTSDIEDVMQRVRGEIELTQQAIEGKRSRGLDSSAFEEKLRGLNAQLEVLINNRTKALMAPPQTETLGLIKQNRGAGGLGDIMVNYGDDVQDALKKAFATNPLDKFLDTFKDRRKKIVDEYKGLRADLAGGKAEDATTLDVSLQLTRGRAALAQGDEAGAQAAAAKAKELFAAVSQKEGTASFEKSYFTSQLESFELSIVDSAEAAATTAQKVFSEKLATLNQDTSNLTVNVDSADLVAQVKAAVDQVKQDLAANPLRIPVVAVPSLSSDGRQSVDLSREALKYGNRR